ncbi:MULTISPECIES: hypothetical protein [Shinella]|jgi:hypothetical protein|uniref:Uncharacterized protein n=1 Tax=Shinella sedimenti TaxID=2919913 RepID=A0ABT0CT66_9HYPH|nr:MULTISPECIES: hypothetical protein [Shinella]MCJ8151788.1 hypothetical protein [Shinella sedimenti]
MDFAGCGDDGVIRSRESYLTRDSGAAAGARTGKEADENRDELLKDAEKGLKNARRKLPKGEI